MAPKSKNPEEKLTDPGREFLEKGKGMVQWNFDQKQLGQVQFLSIC